MHNVLFIELRIIKMIVYNNTKTFGVYCKCPKQKQGTTEGIAQTEHFSLMLQISSCKLQKLRFTNKMEIQ